MESVAQRHFARFGLLFNKIHSRGQRYVDLDGLTGFALLDHAVRRTERSDQLQADLSTLVLGAVDVITERKSPIMKPDREATQTFRDTHFDTAVSLVGKGKTDDVRKHLLDKDVNMQEFPFGDSAVLRQVPYVGLKGADMKQLGTDPNSC